MPLIKIMEQEKLNIFALILLGKEDFILLLAAIINFPGHYFPAVDVLGFVKLAETALPMSI